MNTFCRTCLAVVVTGSVAWRSVSAAEPTRVCSVYVQSFTAFQQQLAVGMTAFGSPQLGVLPMMLKTSVPGAAQMDETQPLALHVFTTGTGKSGRVLELTPSSTPESCLQLLVGQGAQVPAPSNGVYRLKKGMAAKIVGKRLRIALKSDDSAACLALPDSAFPAMPDVPGAVRVSVVPSALRPLLNQFRQTASAHPVQGAGAEAAERGRRTLDSVCAFYGTLLGQIDALALGLEIRESGLFLNSRLTPAAGTDIASLIASAKPASAKELAFMDAGSLFSFATGGSTVPSALKQQLVSLYVDLTVSAPNFKGVETNELAAVIGHSMRMFGAPMAFTGSLSTNGTALLSQGMISVPDPAVYVTDLFALMKMPAYQRMMGQSGMTVSNIATRTYKGMTVYAFKSAFDEAALVRQMGGGATNVSSNATQTAALRTVMSLFGNGYECAAMPSDVAFGMGSPAMVEHAVDRIRSAPGASASAQGLQAALGLSAAPHTLGRFSLSGLFRLSRPVAPGVPVAVKTPPESEDSCVMFGSWVAGGEAHSVLLVPPSEIKAVTAQAQALKGGSRATGSVPQPPAEKSKQE